MHFSLLLVKISRHSPLFAQHYQSLLLLLIVIMQRNELSSDMFVDDSPTTLTFNPSYFSLLLGFESEDRHSGSYTYPLSLSIFFP